LLSPAVSPVDILLSSISYTRGFVQMGQKIRW